MDQYTQSRLGRYAIAIGLALVCILGIYLLWSLLDIGQQTVEAPPLGPSEPIFDAPPEPAPQPQVIEGDVATNTLVLDMGNVTVGEGSYTGSIAVTARDRPARIDGVALPFSQEAGISLDYSTCTGRTLEPGQSCSIDILFDPASPIRIQKRLIIQATSERSDGSERQLSIEVEINGDAIAPAPPPTSPASTPPEEADNPALRSYLDARLQPGIFAASDPDALNHVGPLEPTAEDWTSIGYARNQSTFPVDMSRVVTMDKPIPAVLKLSIDTRYANRAVAQVERDIYGGEGRLVVIPRGSTLIGQVGAISATGEEKVVIAWQRLVRPDGAAFRFEGYAGDAMGRSGVIGYIDNRWMERFGGALMASIVNVAVTLGLDGKQTDTQASNGSSVQTQDAASVATEQFREDFEEIIGQVLAEGQMVPPIRTIPAGTRVTAYISDDLWLRPISPTEAMKNEIRAERSEEAQRQLRSSQTPSTPQTGRSFAPGAYDPVTGQPIGASPPGATAQPTYPGYPAVRGLDAPALANGRYVPQTALPAQARTAPTPTIGQPSLNGLDGSAAQQIQTRTTRPVAPWSTVQ